MSPPCAAAIFEGDNGGATGRAITATEIGVAIPITTSNQQNKQRTITALFDYVNHRFEFYGRRIRPEFVIAGNPNSPEGSRALATELAAKPVFAVVTGSVEWSVGVQDALYQELGRQGVVTVSPGAGRLMSDRVLFDNLHPYLWSVHPSIEDLNRNLASFACTSLAGKPARFAGDPSLRQTTRTLGVLALGQTRIPDSHTLTDDLRACGQSPHVMQALSTNPGSTATSLRAFKDAGITTVICLCERGSNLSDAYSQAADVAGFRPEWIAISSDYAAYEETMWQSAIATRGVNPMWLMSTSKVLPHQARPGYGILRGTAPDLLQATGTNYYYIANTVEAVYSSLLVLASGIQGAGPDLDADSFAAALMAMEFPNPGSGQAPYWQPSAGFGPGDHSFYDDYTIAWWSASAEPIDPNSQAGRGSWCYVNQGGRYAAGSYPSNADELLFNRDLPCR